MWSLPRRRIGRSRRLVKRPRPARDVFFADPAAVEADYRRFLHLAAARPVPR